MFEIDKEQFGRFISGLRVEKGLTQKELAGRLFISDKAVSKWERGMSMPDISLLTPLAKTLDVSVAELLEARRLDSGDTMDTQQIETLVQKAINLSEETPEQKMRLRGRRVLVFVLCVVVVLAEELLFQYLGLEKRIFNNEILVVFEALSLVFGAYFFFFAKERLEAFYDDNRINFMSDGMFRINIPGVYFNNSNWPHILKGLRIWAVLSATLLPIVYMAGQLLLSGEANEALYFISLFLYLGGLFIPVYVIGRKYG